MSPLAKNHESVEVGPRTSAIGHDGLREELAELGNRVLSLDPETRQAIESWCNFLEHPDDNLRREAYFQLQESISSGTIPEELGDLLEEITLQ